MTRPTSARPTRGNLRMGYPPLDWFHSRTIMATGQPAGQAQARRRRATRPSPSSPVASSAHDSGSGTWKVKLVSVPMKVAVAGAVQDGKPAQLNVYWSVPESAVPKV